MVKPLPSMAFFIFVFNEKTMGLYVDYGGCSLGFCILYVPFFWGGETFENMFNEFPLSFEEKDSSASC